jgi:hypothetical protein
MPSPSLAPLKKAGGPIETRTSERQAALLLSAVPMTAKANDATLVVANQTTIWQAKCTRECQRGPRVSIGLTGEQRDLTASRLIALLEPHADAEQAHRLVSPHEALF